MIKIADLYRQTNDGLDIICHYYPEARAVAGTKAMFKCRPGEKTASACLYYKERPSGNVWTVVDYGDEARSLDPIDVAMKEGGFGRLPDALLFLGELFNVRDELNRAVNRPRTEERDARPEEKEGEYYFALKPEIPAEHLKILGPRVTKEDAEALHWYEAEWVGKVRNRRITEEHSTEHYPIFMRECFTDEKDEAGNPKKFFKVYKPFNADKQWRFLYIPARSLPAEYVHGLEELRQLYRDYNARREAEFNADPANENKPFREEKLDEAFICSGERDALCCKSMGYPPLWLNSETKPLSEKRYREIMKYVKVLYNVPDLDETGRKMGTRLALQYIDVHTVWLPETLQTFKDNRGRPRKDLRDWMELRDRREDFRGLMELAMPARFWTEKISEKSGAKRYDIDAACLHYFLRLNGFYTLHDEGRKEAAHVRLTGHVVERIQPKDIRRFLREWAVERCLPRPVHNLLLNSPRLADAALENLKELDLDFTDHTPTSQTFHFKNGAVRVTADGLEPLTGGGGGGENYVWAERVLPHAFTPSEEPFTVRRLETAEGAPPAFDIELPEKIESKVMGYVVNTARTHWRKELETRFAERGRAEALAYHRANRFRIDGEGLTPEEVEEQKRNLVSKLFCIGYMLHRHKSESRAWAPLAMDNKIGEEGQCNGRSGKSFLFKALRYFMTSVTLSGRNPRLMDNPHVFDRVTRFTEFILVDDCDRALSTELFYDMITGDMTVNPKNNQSFSIPYKSSPKFGFTTNYVPKNFDSSTEARLLYMVFSDYYHQQTEENDYLETRSIRDDFGLDLFGSDYTEADWAADYNFFLHCLRFYLQCMQEGVKLQPPIENILIRKLKADMGTNFEEWAFQYFAPEGDHLDCALVRRVVYEDFINDSKVNKNFYTMNRFSRSLRAFAQYAAHVAELNPAVLCNKQGRYSRRVDGRQEEMIYLRTRQSDGSLTDIQAKYAAVADPFTPDEMPFASPLP